VRALGFKILPVRAGMESECSLTLTMYNLRSHFMKITGRACKTPRVGHHAHKAIGITTGYPHPIVVPREGLAFALLRSDSGGV
jgi:hypothetical protein